MAKARILMLEDSESDIFLLRHALDELAEEYELTVFRDGEQAVRHLTNSRTSKLEVEPCVVLLDLHLPRVDGMEVLRAIREESRFGEVPVILCTSGATPEQQAAIRALGAQYRPKPSDLDEVCKLAADLIELCKSPSTA